MKRLCGVLLIALAASDVWTLPARNSPQDDAEVISVPNARPAVSNPVFHDFKGVIDTGAESPFLQTHPSAFNFHLGLPSTFDDIFRRLRTRLWPVVSDSDENAGGDSSEGLTPLGFELRPASAKNRNTTSTVKVVDGHKVEINETVYGDTNSLFKVRLVNVRPLESGEEVAEGVHNNQGEFQPFGTSAPPKRSEVEDSDEQNDRREPLEKQPKDNEVRDIDEPQRTTTTSTTTTTTTETSTLASSSYPAEDSLAESTDNKQTVHTIMADLMEDVMQQQQQQQQQLEEHQQEDQQQEEQQLVEAAQDDADTMAHNEETEMPLPDNDSQSLAAIENFGDETDGDLAEPQLASLQREREELESSDDEGEVAPFEMSDTFNDEWAELDGETDAADPSNDLDNHIDIYENLAPVDLSNDIAVNDVAAADPNYPYNPDAELIELPAAMATMPKFEKLSLTPPTPLMK